MFRKVRSLLGEDRWDWNRAGVPDGIDDISEEAKREKEREKKKRAKQRKKENATKQKEIVENNLQEKQQEIDQLESARRAIENDERYQCKECKRSLGRLVTETKPTCSDDCFKKYRRRLMAEAAEKRFSGK